MSQNDQTHFYIDSPLPSRFQKKKKINLNFHFHFFAVPQKVLGRPERPS